jgi:uncharacterized protein (TIGR02996 family)
MARRPVKEAPRPEVLALLRACKEDPEDDAPRLVLADWLEEHGGPADAARAEFIRMQCELARLDEEDPRRGELQGREWELNGQHAATWLGPMAGQVRCFAFERGLVWVFNLLGRSFFSQKWDRLRGSEAYAWLDGVALSAVSRKDFERLLDSDLLANFNALALNDSWVTAKKAAALARCPHLSGLTKLDLLQNDVGPEGTKALAHSPHLARLRSLNLWSNNVGVEGARALAESPLLARLAHLDLDYNGLGPEGAEALASAPAAPFLTTLELAANGIGPRGVAALLSSPLTEMVTSLHLAWNDLGDEGAQVLARSARLARLRELLVYSNEIGNAGAAALANSPHLAGLRVLNLSGNPITAEGASELADSPYLGNVRQLGLANTLIRGSVIDSLRERFGERVSL